MKFKKLLFTLIAFSVMGIVSAQVAVGTSFLNVGGTMSPKDFPTLKDKKTVFIVDEFEPEDVEKIFKDVWTVNNFEVISREDYDKDRLKYIKEEYAIFNLTGFIKTTRNGTSIYVYIQYYTPIHIKVKKDQTYYDKVEIASIFLAGKYDAMSTMIHNKKFGDLQRDLYNYQLGYLKNYLQFINTRINEKAIWFVPGHVHDDKVKVLRNATLLIPDHIRTSSYTNDKELENPDELFEKYPFKYEWITATDLNNKILAGGTEDFYYLSYIQLNGNKTVSVVNGRTGEVIYKDSGVMSIRIKSKDIKEIASAIGKK